MDSNTLASICRAVWRRRWVAVLTIVLVLGLDALITSQTPRSYQAHASLLIGPSPRVEPGQLVYSVDALGRSMIVGTYANVLASDMIRRDALARADIAADQPESDIQIKTAPLAESAVVQVTAVAPDPNVAAAVANAIGQVGETQMGQLYPMYALTVVTEATPPVGVYRPDVKRNASVGLVLGLLAGAFAAYAYDALALRPRKRNG